jgi:putative phosphoribosyl transferase
MRVFADRHDAGRALAERLVGYQGRSDVIVLGLPRGGVVVAFEVAKTLRAPLDVYVVRKLGVPGQEELAFGAIASGGVRVLNPDVVQAARLSQADIEAVTTKEQAEVERRERVYRGNRPPLDVHGKTVILVDDGLATGASMRTAIRSLAAHHPGWVTMAVPTAPGSTCRELGLEVDEAVCVTTPEPFFGVGQWYVDFSQTTDGAVIDLLQAAANFGPTMNGEPGAEEREAEIAVGPAVLKGTLKLVPAARGLVLFVHGSGSSRLSSRNRAVARHLQSGGLSTLLFDLLTEEEERVDQFTREVRFDIGLLSERVIGVTEWLQRQPETQDLPIGYFGASTGAAAALQAAAHFAGRPQVVRAVVSRGGRPDLAIDALPLVTAPTLLIVGGEDRVVIGLNRRALAGLVAPKELRIVRGATHLFEEPGTLEEVSRLAREWFRRYLDRSSE